MLRITSITEFLLNQDFLSQILVWYEKLKCGTQAKLKENLFPVSATKHKKPHYLLASSVVPQKSRYQIFYKDLFIA